MRITRRQEKGAALVESVLLVALIALIAISSLKDMGRQSKCRLITSQIAMNSYFTSDGVVYSTPRCSFMMAGYSGGDLSERFREWVTTYCLRDSYNFCWQ